MLCLEQNLSVESAVAKAMEKTLYLKSGDEFCVPFLFCGLCWNLVKESDMVELVCDEFHRYITQKDFGIIPISTNENCGGEDRYYRKK